jgi:SAM-dependent methyltransferase
MTAATRRSTEGLRFRFDETYDTFILGAGFVESDEYYRIERERYWRSLELLCQVNTATPAKILEIGGGQLALLCKKLFGDSATVVDLTPDYSSPLRKEGIRFLTHDLVSCEAITIGDEFDIVILLEVIEHIPLPAHVVIERIKPLLKPTGLLFLTTPNLFRIRNLIRMFTGTEFLDRFTIAEPGRGLGHQLEYSADHLQWQLQRAGMEIVMLKHDRLGRIGHSFKTRLGLSLLAPLRLRPIWQDALVAAARKAPRK